jgi:hypothetical protein
MTTNFFSPLSFVAVFGSGIRDKHPGSATLVFSLHTQLEGMNTNIIILKLLFQLDVKPLLFIIVMVAISNIRNGKQNLCVIFTVAQTFS